ncbi:MAG: carbohydrate-binding domain-containing protein [Bacteroidales bacterium]|nr:carbohydrate-binding domain-containing protein [Bacteroidales bacterium]
MKRLVLVISLIIIALSVKAQNGEYHVRIHGQENKGIILDAPVSSIDSMFINPAANNPIKVRTTNNLYSFDYDEVDSLTFPWVPTGSGDIVYITYNGTNVDIVNPYPSSEVIVTASEGKVSVTSTSTQNITYCLSGTSNPGRFAIESAFTPTVMLNGVSLTNPTGKAMDLTCDNGIILQIADGTENILSDGTDSDKKAALMCNSNLLVQGNGTLNVTSFVKHPIKVKGICTVNSGNFVITSDVTDVNGLSADSTLVINGGSFDINVSGDISKGIKCDDNMTINGGDFTIVAAGSTVLEVVNNQNVPSYCTAIKCDNDIIINGGTFSVTLPTSNHGGKSISADGNLTINGGTFDILTQGDGAAYTVSGNTKDSYTSSCLKCDGNMVISAGDFTLRSTGAGGKGITTEGTLVIGTPGGSNNDLILNVTTTGNRITVSSGGGGPWGGGEYANPKAIKAQGLITVNSGTTTVTTTGTGAEGLESKTQINIEGGQHYFKCYDDCINSSGKIFFNGGVTVCFSNGNDAVDSNAGQAGAITIGNGVVFAYTTKGSPEEGFDCDNNNYIRITGTGIGISAGGSQGGGGWPGGGGSGGTITNPAQGYAFYTSSYNFQSGKYYTLSNASGTGGTNMVTFSFEANCNSNLTLITATGMVSGDTYYVKYGTEAPTNPTTAFHGLYLGGTSSASTQAFSFTAQ